MDTSFLNTLKNLTIRPGNMVREYLFGKQKPFLKPLQFYFIMLAFFFLFSEWSHVNPMEIGNKISREIHSPSQNKSEIQLGIKIKAILNNNSKLIFSVMAFMQALSMIIVYRKKGWSFVEYIVFTLYTFGYRYIFSVLLLIGMSLFGDLKNNYAIFFITSLLSFTYSTFSIVQFMEGDKFKDIIIAILSLVLSLIFYVIFTILLSFIIVFTNKYFHQMTF